MDLTTIVATLVVAFGLFTANAVVESDVVTVEFSVPSKYATAGFSAEVAQSFFLAELQDILDTKSMTPGRIIRGTNDKTVVSALAESLKLQDMTYSLQRALGYDVARIRGSDSHLMQFRRRLALVSHKESSDGASSPTVSVGPARSCRGRCQP